MVKTRKAKDKSEPVSPPGKLAILTEVPEWASTEAIAKLLGLTARRIYQLRQDGELTTEKPPGIGARKYRTCETIQKYIAMRERKGGESGDSGKIQELALRKLKAEVALKESQGELHRLKTAIAERKYIAADVASEELAAFMLEFKKLIEAIPGRAARAIPEYGDTALVRRIENSIRAELNALLDSFSAGMIVDAPVKREVAENE